MDAPNIPKTGFTLLELLVVIALVAVLATIAVPGLGKMMADRAVQAEARQLLAAVMLARSRALVSGQGVLCPQPPGEVDCAGHFGEGYAVYGVDSAGTAVLARRYRPGKGLTIRNRSGTAAVNHEVRWAADGLASRNLTLSVCHPRAGDNWSLVLNRIGRPRLVRNWGSCPG